MTEYLRRFLRGADRREQVYEYEQVLGLLGWPPGVLDFFTDLGLIREIEPSSLVWLSECLEPDWVEPEWLPDASKGGQLVGFYHCRYGCGMHEVERDRRRQWSPNLEGIVAAVTKALDTGDDAVVMPGRVYKVGSLRGNGIYRELFLVRGAGWPDAAQVVARADRLRSSPAPAILALDKLPTPATWGGLQPAMLSLAEIASMRDNRLLLDLAPLLVQNTVPHADASTPQWLTVTQAAGLLAKDLPGLTLEQAKARVSVAANRGTLKTNGQTRDKRRIASDGLAAWRLAQRDNDLDAEDAEDSE